MTSTSYDISSLGINAEPPTPSGEYVGPSSGTFEPVAAGFYTATLVDGKFRGSGAIQPGTQKSKKNGKTYLSCRYAVKLENGRQVYGNVSTIPFKLIFSEVEDNRADANAFLDLLMAAGYKGKLESSEDYVNALAELVDSEATLRVKVDWNAYCNPKSTEYVGCGTGIRGMNKFDQNEDGSFNPRIPCTGGDHAEGEAPVLLAQNEIRGTYKVR